MNKFQNALIESVDRQDKENYKNLKELVDRATPKKPELKALSGFSLYEASACVCPCCKERIVNVWSRAEYKPNYCHYCGQAIDWSES